MNSNINELNVKLYAAKHYDSPLADEEEFLEDLQRLKTLRKLFAKFRENKEINIRLALNHIITIHNVFPVPVATRLLFFRLHDYLSQLLPFLIMLNTCPKKVENIGTPPMTFRTDEVVMDQKIIEELRKV